MGENLAEKKTRKKHLKMFPQKVLDEGEIKILGDINMVPKYMYEFQEKIFEARKIHADYDNLWWLGGGERKDSLGFKSKRDYENSPEKIIIDKWNKIQEDEFLIDWLKWFEMDIKFFDKQMMKPNNAIAKYMGVKPFVTSVMINISPNWKGKFGEDKLTDKLMTKKFSQVIDYYLKSSNRYGRWKYVLENGSEGNFLHAHIVAEFNPKCVKSVETHIGKGNHAGELRKAWDKIFPEGYVGLLKGKFAVHRVILRNENLLNDKLNYLTEELKPEGHKNLSDLGILLNEGF